MPEAFWRTFLFRECENFRHSPRKTPCAGKLRRMGAGPSWDVVVPMGWQIDSVTPEGVVLFQGRSESVLATDLEFVAPFTGRIDIPQ